jgi:hypothetical protein
VVRATDRLPNNHDIAKLCSRPVCCRSLTSCRLGSKPWLGVSAAEQSRYSEALQQACVLQIADILSAWIETMAPCAPPEPLASRRATAPTLELPYGVTIWLGLASAMWPSSIGGSLHWLSHLCLGRSLRVERPFLSNRARLVDSLSVLSPGEAVCCSLLVLAKALDSPLLGDKAVGFIDGGDLVGGNRHKLLRHTAGH